MQVGWDLTYDEAAHAAMTGQPEHDTLPDDAQRAATDSVIAWMERTERAAA